MRTRLHLLLTCLVPALPLAATAGARAATIPPGLVVANDLAGTLTSLPLPSSGDVHPVATVSSSSSANEPAGVALDAAGDAWVANSGSNTVVEYSKAQLAAGGTPTPQITLTADAQQSLDAPEGVAFDAAGDLWVADAESNSVVEYTPAQLAAGGAQTPTVTLGANSSQSLDEPLLIAFDSAGDLWVPNYLGNTLVEFTPGQLTASGDPTPAVTISDDGSGDLKEPASVAFDRADDLWTASSGAHSILGYTPAQLTTGDPKPISVISDDTQSLNLPAQVAFDSAGNLWVTDFNNNSVVEFDGEQLAAGGSLAPADTIEGTDTGLSAPEGFAIERAPTVSSISTDRGPSGTQVTISGAGFYPGSVVRFGRAPASVTYVSPYELTAAAPPGTGTVDVTVSTGQGSSPTSPADLFTYGAAPEVTPTLVIGNDSTATLTSFPLSESGDAAPASALWDKSGGLDDPVDGALDAAGDLWVPSLAGEVAEYTRRQLEVGTDEPPAVTLTPNSVETLDQPSGVAFDPAGNLWVTDSGSNSVAEYTEAELTAGGGQAPAVTLQADGSQSLDDPTGIDFDSAGDLWVTNFDGDSVVEYTKSQLAADGAPTPAITLSSDAGSSLASPDALTFDRKGDLWVSNGLRGNTIVEYTPSELATGAPTPAVTLSSDSSGSLDGSDQAQFDAAGDLWVANYEPFGSAGSIVEFTPAQLAASGSPTPSDTIAGGETGLSNPWVLVIEQAPTVTGVTPARGAVAGGTQVTISGTGFYPGSSVSFGQTPAPSVTYVSPYQLTAVAPAGVGTVDVTVSTGQGTSDPSSADQFAYGASTTTGPGSIPTPGLGSGSGSGQTTTAAVMCTLRVASNKVLLASAKVKAGKAASKVVPGTLTLTVKCGAAGKIKLTGTLTQLIGKKPKHGKQKSKTYKLRPEIGAVKGGRALTLTVKLPAAAVTALGNGGTESATFTVVETGAGGGGRATAGIATLAAIR